MLGDPIFWYGLTLKIAMTAGIVVAASVIVERSGPFIGALIAALPTAGGAALIILAFEHPPEFIANGMVGSLIANPAGAIFALIYATLAQKRSLPLSLGLALLVWFLAVSVAKFYPWTVPAAVALNVVVFPPAIWAGRHFRSEGAKSKVEMTGRDLAWRAAVVTVVVMLVTAASHSIGSVASGIFAFFPVAMSSFFIILHSRLGGPAAASVAAHVQLPLVGLSFGFIAVHYLAVPLGVWWAYLIGLAIGVAWNGVLWALRSRR
jgi:uncharacterized membrane protein (GlpM family)